MTILNGSIADALDIEKIIVSNLQSINQNTILSAKATVTDKSYTYASSDTFSDSNGYNNTVDTGDNSNVSFSSGSLSYFVSSGIYDNFDDNSLNATLWDTTISSAGSITETNKRIQMRVGDGVHLYANTAHLLVKSGTNYKGYLKWTLVSTQLQSYTNNAEVSVYVGSTLIVDKRLAGATYNDYAAGTWELIGNDLYKDNVFVRTIAGTLSGQVKFHTSASVDTSNVTFHYIDEVYLNTSDIGVVQTNSKTFGSNVKSILVNANKVLNGDSTITVDVSSDGGSTWDVTEQALDTIIELDGDDNDIVIKFNLNVDGNNSPELYGYSYQVFT